MTILTVNNCSCPNQNCEKHGKCNECINCHNGRKTPVHCLNETINYNNCCS